MNANYNIDIHCEHCMGTGQDLEKTTLTKRVRCAPCNGTGEKLLCPDCTGTGYGHDDYQTSYPICLTCENTDKYRKTN